MLLGLYIFVDDDFDDPVYADPALEDLDEEVRVALCEAVDDAIEGDGPANGHRAIGEVIVAWRTQTRTGLSFVAVVEDLVKPADAAEYLSALTNAYMDEVDDPRNPERDGVADVVADVLPPWDE
jgi:hypothetical protein